MNKIIVISFLVIGAFIYNLVSGKNGIPIKQISISDSLEKDRAKYVAIVLKEIKGKETMSADSVFKNIKIFKGMPANRLLAIMNFGYSKSLGVSCSHCHNTDDFSSEEKKQKEIARQMSAMNKEINNNLLKNINNLQSNPAVVNCTTCHRGQIKPALDME